ncbi:MAG: EAL domain-containing protein [Gammaproteobacteria bacterium]|nr:EAL domain-containing protein [Gammaproteobacteria bacterium]
MTPIAAVPPAAEAPPFSALFDAARYAYAPSSLFWFTAAAALAALAVAVVRQERSSRIAAELAVAAALMVLWLFDRGLARLAGDPALVMQLARYGYVFPTLAAPLLCRLVALQMRNGERRRGWVVGNWIAGALLAYASLGTPWVVAGTLEYGWGLEPRHGPLGHALVAWLALLIAVAVADFLRGFLRAARGGEERRRLAWVGLALAAGGLSLTDFLAASGIAVFPLSWASLVLFGGLFGYLSLHYGLEEISPELAVRQIARVAGVGLLLVDTNGIVRFLNRRAAKTLELDERKVPGTPLRLLLGEEANVERLTILARFTDDKIEKELSYVPAGTDELHRLSLSVAPVLDHRGRDVAYVCSLRDVTEQQRREQQRQTQALQDRLTGLANRTAFLAALDKALRRAREFPPAPFAVYLTGLDRLRVVNEDLGFAAGDQVLRETGRRLRAAVGPHDWVARLDGDEFAVLLHDVGDRARLRDQTAELDQAVRQPIALGDQRLYVQATSAVMAPPLPFAGGAELMRHASIALHRAKWQCRGEVHFAEPGARGGQRTRLEAELHDALERGQFEVRYQPIVDFRARCIVGFEALLRWAHPARGLLQPAEFMDTAAEIGLLCNIDRMTLERVCRDFGALRRRHAGRAPFVSVNVTDCELLDAGFAARLRAHLDRHGLPPAAFRLELLEQIGHGEGMERTLHELRRLGIGLCIDDFGTRYSTLSRLHTLPITGVKIDREFTRAMLVGEDGQRLVQNIVTLARSLSLEVIVEGVSMAEEAVRVGAMGCRYAQGFFFSEAVTLAEAEALLAAPAAYAEQFDTLDAMRPEPAPGRAPPDAGVVSHEVY